MKKVQAIIRPTKLEEVKVALEELGGFGMTILDARGFGKQQGRTEKYRGSTYTVNLLPKVVLETVVPDEKLEDVLAVIGEAAKTGEIGDGRVFVSDIEEAIRIRTGDRGEIAL